MKWFGFDCLVVDIEKLFSLENSPHLSLVRDRGIGQLWHKDISNHYRLLIYFASLFKKCNIVEVGTFKGQGAISLAYNDNNVFTFDINHSNLNHGVFHGLNIKAFLREPYQNEDKELILNTPFIFYDAEHDGVCEKQFFDLLLEINYNGWVLWDDIYENSSMRDFWHKITQPKIDLTPFGHSAGSGLTSFNKQAYLKLI